MKQEILCEQCGKRFRVGVVHKHPREEACKVAGFARADFACDQCGILLPPGALVYAASLWSELGRVPYYPWEADYIENPLGAEELDAHERLDSK